MATASEAFHFDDAGRAVGHDVMIVSATLARTLSVGARGVKRDLQVFVATLVLTLERHTVKVLASEVTSLSGGWPLGTRWRPDW